MLRDGDGIEVIPPPGATVEETPDGLVMITPFLSLTTEGHWLAWSTKEIPSPGSMKLYVNALAESAIDVWLAVSDALAETDLTCQVKVAASVELARRADCLVVYAHNRDLERVAAVVRKTADPGLLGADVPGFAWPISRGIAVGLPDGEESFLVSTGLAWSARLVDAFLAGPSDIDRAFERLATSQQHVIVTFSRQASEA
ncbi:T3SS effector HopA1 family protein [Streptomyces aurantiacus]|uniref:T3SS effector HopA1 family protein n=1 Tax=Streptomyces aurantiacus TaxID=47760 RepID=UPI0012FEE450|nr:T3SS effector HopA1 family protein [Streptomyces aurantiacus]